MATKGITQYVPSITVARRIARTIAETDKAIAAPVMALAPIAGDKSVTIGAIVAGFDRLAEESIMSGNERDADLFTRASRAGHSSGGRSTLANALAVARAMASRVPAGEVGADASEAIAAAAVVIVRASKANGGGVEAMTAAVEYAARLATPVEMVESIQSQAALVSLKVRESRRVAAKRPGAITPGGKGGENEPADEPADGQDEPAGKASPVVKGDTLRAASIGQLIAELSRRVASVKGGLHRADVDAFDRLAELIEERNGIHAPIG